MNSQTNQTSMYQKDEVLWVPLDQIRRNPNVDPRKGRNKAKYENMKVSVKAEGVYLPILIRPVPGFAEPYEIVYGNTRYDLSCDVGTGGIPAQIREMSDIEARKAAAIENLQRADLTPIEEAYHVVQMMIDHANDFAEVGRVFGWSRTKIESRLLLSKCVDEVAEALLQGEIKLGHAELLAPMTGDDQRVICEKIIERKMTVAQTRARLLEQSSAISTAPFDTTACKGCQHNSAQYVDLFDTSLNEAKCQNRSCWLQKTDDHVAARLEEAQKEFGVVHTDMSLPDSGYVLLEVSGKNGVGADQFSACTGCATYGAVVSTKAGSEGRIVGGHCFNKACHSQHNTNYKALIAATSASILYKDVPSKPVPGATVKGGSSGHASATVKAQDVKKSIRKEAFKLYAKMAAKAILENPSFPLAVAIVSLYLEMRSELPDDVSKRIQAMCAIPNATHGSSRAQVEAQLAQRPVEELQTLLTQVASCTVSRRDSSEMFQRSVPGAQSLALIKVAGMDPVDHFDMTEEYLSSLTKAGVVADCKASGFEAAYDAVHGVKEFSKLAAGKVDLLIKAVLGFENFSWKGYLPDTMKISAHESTTTA